MPSNEFVLIDAAVAEAFARDAVESETPFDRALWVVQRCANEFAASRFLQLATAVAEQLRGEARIGLYEDAALTSLWEEYCHSTWVEDGEMETAWQSHIASAVALQVKALSPPEAVFLSVAAAWDDEAYDRCVLEAIDSDALVNRIARELRWLATS